MSEERNTTTPPRIELRVRNAIQPPVQDRIREIRSQLQDLSARDVIDRLDVEVWGTHVDLDPTTPSTDHYETYVEFAEWAASNGYELGPGFRIHRPTSLLADDDYPVVTVPLVSLAIYDGDSLRAVYPHTRSDAVQTIEDALGALTPEPITPTPSTPP